MYSPPCFRSLPTRPTPAEPELIDIKLTAEEIEILRYGLFREADQAQQDGRLDYARALEWRCGDLKETVRLHGERR